MSSSFDGESALGNDYDSAAQTNVAQTSQPKWGQYVNRDLRKPGEGAWRDANDYQHKEKCTGFYEQPCKVCSSVRSVCICRKIPCTDPRHDEVEALQKQQKDKRRSDQRGRLTGPRPRTGSISKASNQQATRKQGGKKQRGAPSDATQVSHPQSGGLGTTQEARSGQLGDLRVGDSGSAFDTEHPDLEGPVNDLQPPFHGQQQGAFGQHPRSYDQNAIGYGPDPSSYGEYPSSYGQIPNSYGPASISYGQNLISYGESPSGYGQSPSSYSQTPSDYGQYPSDYGQNPTSSRQPIQYGQPSYDYQLGSTQQLGDPQQLSLSSQMSHSPQTDYQTHYYHPTGGSGYDGTA